MIGINGTLTTRRGATASFDQSFGDVLDKLHGAPFMGAAEADYGRFAIIGDLTHLPVSVPLRSRENLFTNEAVNINTTIGTVAGLYRVVESGANNIEIGAGARAYGVSNTLSLRTVHIGPRSISFWNAWADPLIVARAHADFGNGFGASLYSDVGGFGAGSQLTWQVSGSADYQVNNAMVMRVGYRCLTVNLDGKRDLNKDLRINGPFLAATFRF